MTVTITATPRIGLTVRESLTSTEWPGASRRVLVHDAFNVAPTLNATSTPPATKVAANTAALVAGAKTLDLTAIVHEGPNTPVNGTGLKVVAFLFANPAANTHPIVIVPGASNGYNFLGATSKVILYPGDVIVWAKQKDADTPDIAAGAKTLDVSDGGAAATESFQYVIVMG
jgi:hypothetical protein